MYNMNNQWQWMEVGRMVVDYNILDEFAKIYKRKVMDFLTFCQDRVVIFDFDGTMTEFKYAQERLLPCNDADLNEYFQENDFYKDAKPLQTMQFVIETLAPIDTSTIYILTVSQENVEAPKARRIKQIYPSILEENVYHVRNSSLKSTILQEIYDKHHKEIVFVEDKAETLLQSEEALPFVKGYHISSLLP